MLQEPVDEAWRCCTRAPAKAEHGEVNWPSSERERLVAAPHVEVYQTALDRRTRIQDGVDAVVPGGQGVDLDHRADGQQRWVGGRNPGLDCCTRCRGDAFAVSGGAERHLGTRGRVRGFMCHVLPGRVLRVGYGD